MSVRERSDRNGFCGLIVVGIDKMTADLIEVAFLRVVNYNI